MELSKELELATWVKSSRSSSNGGECVEVALLSGDRRGVRDSKDPSGPALVFTRPGWGAFVSGVKRGEFDI
ncbi:DUF397 domain-containing protein [Streptosporangium carneum]|uniref:DUF397 domain-containing protein n=1 Tax=Streptosporangium carneum TaxID=47481 RepID=A0A9W6I398_9ACTN|nr:DUF397 domain-containing protein [Streptosporangium carneum]GLK11250.1 hypothetical protein GCM10017600_46560 [Streptosporangium carneum]